MDKKTAKIVHMAAFSLLVVGGLNWGIYGLFDGLNVVSAVVGSWPVIERIVYVLVGVSAVYIAATHMQDCKICSEKKS